MRDFNRREKYDDFDAIEDPDTGELLIMEINPRVPACIQMAMVSGINWAEIIRTGKLMPTLWFMQDAGWKIWELTPDDEYISWVKFERNILTYYKPKSWN